MRVKSLIIASIISLLFLWLTVFSPSSAFNFLPYLIHEYISPGGKREAEFIRGFDIAFSILLFFAIYKIANRFIARKEA